MTAATQTIQLSMTTYEQLVAAAQQQQLDIEALIQNFLQQPKVAPAQSKHRFAYLLDIAEDMGIDDLSENHDHYLYGADKR